MEDELFEPACYERLEDYDMNEKRSYKEVLASVETSLIYMNNHLGNIDSHMERQNNSLTEHGKSITKNTTWISALKYAVYVIVIALIGTITTGIIGVW